MTIICIQSTYKYVIENQWCVCILIAFFVYFQWAERPPDYAASVEKCDQVRKPYSNQLFWNDGVDDQLPEFGNAKLGEAAGSKAN